MEHNLGVELEEGMRSVHVLVVEDIALNQLLMKTLLEDFGFGMDIAANGKIAIEKLKENSYDIILMDLQMPEMNGFEATEHIRKEMNIQIPIIALTADVTTVDVAKCKAVGMNDYISKPVDEKLLYSKIIKHLKKQELSRTILPPQPEGAASKWTNLSYLRKLSKGNGGMVKEMIEIYLHETPELLHKIKTSLDERNWEELKLASHSLIPSFAMMGMDKRFSDSAKSIQEHAAGLISGSHAGNESAIICKMLEQLTGIQDACSQAYEELKEAL
jgi:CheY-like chemotaxis protein